MIVMFKYPSMVGEAHTKVKQQFFSDGDIKYLLYPSEKLDGSNFSIRYDIRTNNFYTNSRNNVVDSNWSGIKDCLGADYAAILAGLANLADTLKVPDVIIYGEVYGDGILSNRMGYPEGRHVKFYSLFAGVVSNNPSKEDTEDNTTHGFARGYMYYLPKFHLLETHLSSVKPYLIGETEGVWINDYKHFESLPQLYPNGEGTVWHRPKVWLDTVKVDNNPVCFKQRNEAFLEQRTVPKKSKTTPSEFEHPLRDYVVGMVTENRLRNVISKEVEPLVPETIGFYIKKLNEDIQQEFQSTHPEISMQLSKLEYKQLLNVNNYVANLVKDSVKAGVL